MVLAEISETPRSTRPDGVIPQNWSAYTAAEHAVWTTLYERQAALLPGRACQAFLDGLTALDLGQGGIPDFADLNERLGALTGWTVVAVPGLVSDPVFFEHLAHRRFPAGRFIRRPDQLDYLQEPDVFHDVFGHVPMLTDRGFADFLQAYGQGGLRAMGLNHLHHLARLYWYTVEFGLIQEPGGLRIYGAGIVSSAAESRFCLDSPEPHRIAFDLLRTMRTPYRIDDFQQTYMVIPSLAALRHATLQDFGPVYDRLEGLADLDPARLFPGDRVIPIAGAAPGVPGPPQ
jgi:phenylalanine-4-hydroxylase